MDADISCTRGVGYILCLVAAFTSLIISTQLPGVTVDAYSTNLQTGRNLTGLPSRFHDEGIIENEEMNNAHEFIVRDKPIVVDMSHGVSVTSVLYLGVLVCFGFVFMTARMEQKSDPEAFTETFSTDNPGVVGSSSAILWDALFVMLIGVVHFAFLCMSCTPCSWIWLILAWILYTLPLAAIVQPKRATMQGKCAKGVFFALHEFI